MPKYRIMKLRADRIIELALQTEKEDKVYYQSDLEKNAIYGTVVEELLLMESCALFDQFGILLKKEETKEEVCEWLLHELVIVDFAMLYKGKTSVPEKCIQRLIEDGFWMRYADREIHMLPFDKSNSMSRSCRLSFINAKYLDEMNERLNLGMDFTKLEVNLSKYYAYRGLYLSTAKRMDKSLLTITPETMIVIKDVQDFKRYAQNAFVVEGSVGEGEVPKISYKTEKRRVEEIDVPYDGQGIVSPLYADWMEEALGSKKINSFQIRLPFSKGMLHRVDFHAFFKEFDPSYSKQDSYLIKDAFGIERDLKRANIIMTKSMFKCFDWIKSFAEQGKDPMKYYCNAIERYQHALYVSSTDLPYGHSKVTHLSYQLLNTLALSERQFESLISKQLKYIHNPIKYIEMCQGQCVENDEEGERYYIFPNWQKALLKNPAFGQLPYIKEQLKNIQSALMTKLVLGKLVVKGQTRFMARDLPFMLVSLIQDKDIRVKLNGLKTYPYRFFLPQGTEGKNEMELDYNTYCGFFRSPHLSRNEQGVLAPFVHDKKHSEDYNQYCDTINKYFGHLTGVVMFGNESLEPMALGGADFDGDLVSMIVDEDVVDAIKSGVYIKTGENPLSIERKEEIPYIKIPSVPAPKQRVPKLLPYEQIKNTFSNKIGLISNAAITIGQSEYGTKEKKNLYIKCSHCTILTGLEIDAAKNGVHPDLTILTENRELTTCNYLVFKNNFEKLKKHKDYHFNLLQMNKSGEKYVLTIKGNDKIKLEYTEESGTYINKLPIVFMENLNPNLELPKVKSKDYFRFPEIVSDENEHQNFLKDCDDILEAYAYYSKWFDTIRSKMQVTKNYKANLNNLLHRQYDREVADKIIAENVYNLFVGLARKINTYTEFKAIEKKLRDREWHLFNVTQKKEFLCEIMDVDVIDEQEWEIVLQPYNQGYKVLWYLVQMIGESLVPQYEELNELYGGEYNAYGVYGQSISKQAKELLKRYVEDKEDCTSQKVYDICLCAMKKLIEDYELPIAIKVKLLFERTKKEGANARFFWEGFEWEELEPYIMKEVRNAE